MKNSLYILSIVFLFIQCGDKQVITPEEANLGEIEFEVTGSVEATPYFHEGL